MEHNLRKPQAKVILPVRVCVSEGCVKPVLMFACDRDIRGNNHVLFFKPFFHSQLHEPDLIHKVSFTPRIISF